MSAEFGFILLLFCVYIFCALEYKAKSNTKNPESKKKAYAKIVDFFHPLSPSVRFAHFGKWLTIIDDP
jgi:hypothetical protein